MNFNSQDTASRLQQLKEVAEAYFDSLRKRDFNTIVHDKSCE